MWSTQNVQPLLSRYRDYAPPDVVHVAEAAELLAIGEYELFRLAHRWWYDSPCDEALLNKAFGEYLVHATVPPWARHYCRRVLVLAAVGQLDPRDFGVERRSVRRLTGSEQRFASLVTLFAFFVYWLFFA